jgi:hypothetical protein
MPEPEPPQPDSPPDEPPGDHDFYQPGNYADSPIIGNSLPSWWRPGSPESIWNRRLSADVKIDPRSAEIIKQIADDGRPVRLPSTFYTTVYVIDARRSAMRRIRAWHRWTTIPPWLDRNNDQVADEPVPVHDKTIRPRETTDSDLVLVDPFQLMSWQFSRFGWKRWSDLPFDGQNEFLAAREGDDLVCSKYCRASLGNTGTDDDGNGLGYWKDQPAYREEKWLGPHASGIPLLFGMLRPEPIQAGLIRHKLSLTMRNIRRDLMRYPPALRNDGTVTDHKGLMYGTVIQLDPAKATEENFKRWGLSTAAKVVARAWRDQGAIVTEGGGPVIQIQGLDADPDENRRKWDRACPGLYDTIRNIPWSATRVIGPEEYGQREINEK